VKRLGLWLRWSWRDMRSRWIQVAAIALVIALGTGTYAGLGSVARWRQASADASFELLGFHDVEVRLSGGSLVADGALLAVLDEVPDGLIAGGEERLRADIQVDASTADRSILVPGVLVGVSLTPGIPVIDRLYPMAGRGLETGDSGQPVAVLEHNFAEYYELAESGTISVSGDRRLEYVGHASSPEYFIVMPDDGAGYFLHANFAAVFTSLKTAQELAGLPGLVNNLVVTLPDGTSAAVAAAAIEEAFATSMPDVGMDVVARDDHLLYSSIYADIENDQQLYNLFAFLIFFGAIAAAFNLTTRLVEAQRREIGIAMALGVPRRRIAVRPLLVGLQIALLGVVFGIGVGVALSAGMKPILQSILPLPVWQTDFEPSSFAGAAAIGVAVPFLATIVPVWRAVRVRPIEAIRTAHLARRIRVPWRHQAAAGNTFRRLPFRNLFRATRRTVLTAIGIAAAIAVAVGLLGMLDSFTTTLDISDEEIAAGGEDRVLVEMNWAYPETAAAVRAVVESPAVGTAETSLQLPGRLVNGDAGFDVLISLADFETTRWLPTVLEGSAAADRAGVLISQKAAADLAVGVGETVTLSHPVRTGLLSFSFEETELEVLGVHRQPYRFALYMDDSQTELMGMEGMVNLVSVTPAQGGSIDEVKRELFGVEAVASVQPASVAADTLRDLLSDFLAVFQAIEVVVFLLALVIAFNSASLNLDERARDHATMFAFGVRVRTALRMAVVEGATLGLIATALGLVAGYGIVRWFVTAVATDTAPDLGLIVTISPQSLLLVFLFGVAAVALAPVFTLRKMRRMDVPGTLRIME
jgi:putative ABC transport system permease protein